MVETIGTLIIGTFAPGAITGIGFGAALSGTTILGFNLATIVGTAAVIGASIGLQYALRPGVPAAQDGSQPLKQGIPPRLRGYGRCRVAGYYMLFEENAGQSYDVIAWHSGRAWGIVDYYLHDDVVVLSGEIVNSTVPDGRYGYGDGTVRIRSSLGDINPPPPTYFSDPGEGFTGVWNGADMRGNDIAWLSLYCRKVDLKDASIRYPRGLPVPSVVADLSLVWDPRDPSQNRADPFSWKISYNPVVHLIDFLTRVDGGLGLDYDVILAPVIDKWVTEANLCEVLVDKADGSQEYRYVCCGWFTFDTKPEDVINSILATCDGWMTEGGDGTLALKVGVFRDPTVTIEAQHILDFAINYGVADEQAVNQLNVTYTEPAQKYTEMQTDPYRDEDAISEMGVVRSQALDLKWVQSASQARRLAQRAMLRLNPSLSGSFVTTLYGLAALGERWVTVKYPYVSGLQDEVVEIQGAELDLMAGRIKFDFIRVSTDAIEAYDPATDEGSPPVIPPDVPVQETFFREDGSPFVREDNSVLVRES